MKRKSIIQAFLVLLLIANLTGCKDKDTAVEVEPFKLSDSLLQIISIEEVELRAGRNYLSLNGKVTFETENVVEIFPMFGGNVVEVRAELGDYVKKGEILAVIRSSEVADFQQEEKEANSNIRVAQRNFDMMKDMSESGLASDKDLIEAEAELENAKAQLKRIKEVISIYNIRDNSEYVIRSPISGFIVEKNISREMQLRSDSDREIFIISKLDDVWVLADVYESDIGKVKHGNDVEIHIPAYPDMRFRTKVDKIYNVLEPESNTLTIRMKLKNENYLLKTGMFTKVFVQYDSGKEMFPAISEGALIFDRNKYFVIVVAGNDFEIREVEPFHLGVDISIKSGLQVGERVVSKNALLIYNEIKNN